MRLNRTVCGAVVLLFALLLLPGTIEAQRGRAAQLVKIRVRADEDIATLAERYNVTAEEIARLNALGQDAQLPPGTSRTSRRLPSVMASIRVRCGQSPSSKHVSNPVRFHRRARAG